MKSRNRCLTHDEVYCWSNKENFDINAAENRPVKVVIPGFNGDGTSMKFGKKLYNLRDYGLPYDYYIDSYIVTSVYDVKKRRPRIGYLLSFYPGKEKCRLYRKCCRHFLVGCK